MRVLPSLILVLAGLTSGHALAGAGLPMQPRNDTGQTVCTDDLGQVIPCALPGYPGQDGRYGRDAAAAAGVLSKVGGGVGGFDFTKIANNGSDLPSAAALGGAPNAWACTRDNLTGLLWEIKIADASSPRHFEWHYHWYNTDDTHNGGFPGEPSGPSLACYFTLDCDTQAYVNYINGIALCGRTDWRLPTLDELQGIVNFGSSFFQGGAMDRDYFADGGGYSGYAGAWTVDTAIEPDVGMAMAVNFDDGHAEPAPKMGMMPIRLVSGELIESTGQMPTCGGTEQPQIRPGTAGAYTLDDALVTDARTALVWSRCLVGQEFIAGGGDAGDDGQCSGDAWFGTWQDAMAQVKALNAANHLGHADWRLPNMKELVSTLERRCASPAMDVRVFPLGGEPSMEPVWSSTSSTYNSTAAFALGLEFGHQLSMLKDGPYGRIRPVRGGGPFDDYEGTVQYSVGGNLSGLLGTGLQLRLETGNGNAEALTLDANGSFVFIIGLDDGESFEVMVQQPPVPEQTCHVDPGQGVIAGGDFEGLEVTCDEPPPPHLQVEPPHLHFQIQESGSDSQSFGVANHGGGILEWTVQTAYQSLPVLPRGGEECQSEPGLIVHDDGTAENAIGGNAFWAGGVAVVDKFTPSTYPASIGAVCFSFGASAGVDSLDFEIVVFDDNGPGGAPGTELASLAVTATGIPTYPVATPLWHRFDLSSLYVPISNGSVYVGLRWQPANPQVYVLMDQSDDRPEGYAGGYYWNWAGAGNWTPVQGLFAGYRSMFIRAVESEPTEPPVGCESPTAVPWLDITPLSGSVNAGDESPVDVSINSAGLEPGSYHALICVFSNDPGQPFAQVHVDLHVEPGIGVLGVTPDQIDFGAIALGTSAPVQSVTLSNSGTGAVNGIAPASAIGPFSRSGGDCPATGSFSLAPNGSCTLAYAFAPDQLGPVQQPIEVASDVGPVSFLLTGEGLPGAPATITRLSGDGQSAVVGQPFAQPLAVLVHDAWGHPVPAAELLFDAPAGGPGALLSATTVHTDGNGYASVAATANAQAGGYTAMAILTASGDGVEFALENLPGSADLGISLLATRDYVRPGQVIDYLVVLYNQGPDAAAGVEVVSALAPELDLDAAHWQCLGPAASGCASSGQGNLADSGLDLPAGGGVGYLLSAPVRLDADEAVVATSVLVDGGTDGDPGNDIADSEVPMVLYRDGFQAYGDGASGLPDEADGRFATGDALSLDLPPDPAGTTLRTVLAARGDGPESAGFRIERLVVSGIAWVRAVVVDPAAGERASRWLPAGPDDGFELALLSDESEDEPVAGEVLVLGVGPASARIALAAAPAGYRYWVIGDSSNPE